MTNSIEKINMELLKREIRVRNAKESLLCFTEYTFPAYKTTWFHKIYVDIVEHFVKGNIKKLMISMPPQFGKSEISTRRLPAYLLGRNPKLKLGISSYNATKSREFSRDVQRIIADPLYHKVFPNSLIAGNEVTRGLGLGGIDAVRTQEFVEVFNPSGMVAGSVRAVGRGGALTGNLLDIMIMDDLYKDYKEANSSVIRTTVIDWYTSVVRTRFHNLSQELMVFTRWHPDDLIGFLEREEDTIDIRSFKDLENINPDCWYKLNFPALMTADNFSDLDEREIDESLWPERHSVKKLLNYRKLDKEKFESLYQGDPKPLVGLLFQEDFKTYRVGHTPNFRVKQNYTDTADTGSDYLCSINYAVGVDDNIYILDLEYTQEPQEITEQLVSDLLGRGQINRADIESNNGGRAFARNVDRITKGKHVVEWFHQKTNKESRILSNSSNIKRHVYFPVGWEGRWPLFYKHIMTFKRNFKSNTHDDCIDALTGCWEYSGLDTDSMQLWS